MAKAKTSTPPFPYKICSIPNCNRRRWARGYCGTHYVRWRTYGDASYPLKKAPNGSGFIRDGYQMWPRKGKSTREHRIVMEQHLGRPLTSDELVHHRDHNKRNNHIENLQVMSRADHARLHTVRSFSNTYARTCSICNQIKPRSEFGPASKLAIARGEDPNHTQCRQCARRGEMYRKLFH